MWRAGGNAISRTSCDLLAIARMIARESQSVR